MTNEKIKVRNTDSGQLVEVVVFSKRAEAIEVRAQERVVAGEVEMVADQHHVARLEVRVETASGVREDHRLDAERQHRAQEKRRLAM